MLLDTLASAAAAVGGGVFGCSSRLMRRSFPFEEQLFQSTPIPGYGACQLQQIYAGALLLARPGVDDLSQAIQSHGCTFSGSGQCLRAVQCFKMYFVMNPLPLNAANSTAENCIRAIAEQYAHQWIAKEMPLCCT
ncbi:TPA: hypothetical protein ACH3X3_013669 [Trebouxia sp. C0006]